MGSSSSRPWRWETLYEYTQDPRRKVAPRPEPPTHTRWKKRDGTTIRIRDMGDSHLGNAIRMLQRAAASRQQDVLMCPPSFGGEMAQYYAEQEWEQALSRGDDPAYHFPIYNDLVTEAERRQAAGAWTGGVW